MKTEIKKTIDFLQSLVDNPTYRLDPETQRSIQLQIKSLTSLLTTEIDVLIQQEAQRIANNKNLMTTQEETLKNI